MLMFIFQKHFSTLSKRCASCLYHKLRENIITNHDSFIILYDKNLLNLYGKTLLHITAPLLQILAHIQILYTHFIKNLLSLQQPKFPQIIDDY